MASAVRSLVWTRSNTRYAPDRVWLAALAFQGKIEMLMDIGMYRHPGISATERESLPRFLINRARMATAAFMDVFAQRQVYRELSWFSRLLLGMHCATVSVADSLYKFFLRPVFRWFRRVLRRSGVPRQAVLCIGDETRDIEAAAGLGLAAGAVTWGYATAEILRAHGPTHVFHSLDEIGALLTGGASARRLALGRAEP